MLKTVKDACQIFPATLDYQTAEGVENLLEALRTPDGGQAFFEKTYLTQGMEQLLCEGLLRLSGQTDQALFELAQAMGGGKTHLMTALGLLAQNPALRPGLVPASVFNRLDHRSARIAVFDGRESPNTYLWGAIAEQLGAGEQCKPFWQNGPKAPGKGQWKEMIGEEPTLILFDELPPYFLDAKTVTVGQGALVDVLTRALANLFAAALELPRCCIVLANLADSYHQQVKEVRKLVADVQREASRQAKVITPVSLEGGEIYAILRKRLFATLPTEEEIDEIAEAYAEQIKGAEDSGYLTARSLEQVADEIRVTYPFHPAYKHLVALFKDNPNFRETRGLLQFTARLTRSVWQRPQNDVYLIGTQHLNLNDSQVMEEVSRINLALRPAIVKDVAENGNAHAEEADANLNSDAGSQVAALLLSASLSLAVKGHVGLRREEMMEYLLAPNRKADEFSQAFDLLKKRAWYLHANGELFYFSDTENLTKRIQREAQGIPKGKIDKALCERLEGLLKPQSRQAYQELLVMPEINDINLGSYRVLVVVAPDNSVPPEEIQRFYRSVAEKNHLLVLSGNDTYIASRVEECLRELYATDKIARSLPEGSNLKTQAQEALEDAERSFLQALQGTYNRLFFPGEEGLRMATISNGLKFGEEPEAGAEKQIEDLLAGMNCDNKLARDAETDPTPYFAMAEEDLWPQGDRRTPWRDVVMRAKSNPAWPWLPGLKGLENLRARALNQGRWREGADGYLEKGPFPKEKTALNIIEQGKDPQTGEIILSLTPQNAGPNPRVHYAPSAQVSETDPLVTDLEAFRTGAATLYFLVVDSAGEHETGEPTRWVAKLKVRYQVHDRPDGRRVELAVVPAAELRYVVDGTNPREGPVYTEPFAIPDTKATLLVYAQAGEASAVETFTIPEKGNQRAEIDENKPAKLVREKTNIDSTYKVFEMIKSLKERQGVIFRGVILTIGEGERGVQVRFNDRPVTPGALEHLINDLRKHLQEPDALVQVKIRDGADFETGFDLKRFAEIAGIDLTPDKVEQ